MNGLKTIDAQRLIGNINRNCSAGTNHGCVDQEIQRVRSQMDAQKVDLRVACNTDPRTCAAQLMDLINAYEKMIAPYAQTDVYDAYTKERFAEVAKQQLSDIQAAQEWLIQARAENPELAKDLDRAIGKAGVHTAGVLTYGGTILQKSSSVLIKTNNTSGGTANSFTGASLRLDLKTTQAANEVVDSLRTTGRLPSNYVTKQEAMRNGWQPGKALNNTSPGAQIGGDVFSNSPAILPSAPGRIWYEADIGISNTMSRSNVNQPGSRLLYSNDGHLYITNDHYKNVYKIGNWK